MEKIIDVWEFIDDYTTDEQFEDFCYMNGIDKNETVMDFDENVIEKYVDFCSYDLPFYECKYDSTMDEVLIQEY